MFVDLNQETVIFQLNLLAIVKPRTPNKNHNSSAAVGCVSVTCCQFQVDAVPPQLMLCRRHRCNLATTLTFIKLK